MKTSLSNTSAISLFTWRLAFLAHHRSLRLIWGAPSKGHVLPMDKNSTDTWLKLTWSLLMFTLLCFLFRRTLTILITAAIAVLAVSSVVIGLVFGLRQSKNSYSMLDRGLSAIRKADCSSILTRDIRNTSFDIRRGQASICHFFRSCEHKLTRTWQKS